LLPTLASSIFLAVFAFCSLTQVTPAVAVGGKRAVLTFGLLLAEINKCLFLVTFHA